MKQAHRIRVRGQVQGVGFRPFVWTLAQRFGLRGRVLNDAEGVLIEAEGANMAGFIAALCNEAPPLARVRAVEVEALEPVALPEVFEIIASAGGAARTRVTPDAATCPACLSEIRDPSARRLGYAFTNCTHCGPRFSILHALPYDRAQTTMAKFDMCSACVSEYTNPADRRFHAQPIACPDCGPRIWFEHDGQEISGQAMSQAAAALASGKILAIKGIGGFHLACDAGSEAAVMLLRTRKRRPTKPFALMGTLEMIRAACRVSQQEIERLQDVAAPIVLLRRMQANHLAQSIAPGQPELGWMVPYTPLHHVLLDAFGAPLVMTSGNLSGEPQVTCNTAARTKLRHFVDGFLMHDRQIARRLDDSVERVTAFGPMILRHSRGRAPATQSLPPGFENGPQVLGMGGQMKAAFCLTRDQDALLSHHLGDLDESLTWDEYQKALIDYSALFAHRPDLVAVDAHSGFRTTQAGHAMGLPVIEVFHHHAHLAACLGENGWPRDGGKVAAIVLDGLGLGPDGTIWGGELLLGDYRGFDRIAWLEPAPLPGGDMAQREPWRNALVRLDAAGRGQGADRLFPDAPRAMVRQASAARVNAPMSSSAGRLFDAVAAMLDLCPARQSHEAEAAMALEALAQGHPQLAPYPMGDGPEISTGPLFASMLADLDAGCPRGQIAARFHATLAQAFAGRARQLVEDGAAQAVVLTGGCFQNTVLLDNTLKRLRGLHVMHHTQLPANDGSLAFGQALIGIARHDIST